VAERNPIFYSAVYVLLRQGNQILLQRRLNTGYMDGHYDMSATGHVEPHESIYAAAMRETKEEIGVDIEEQDLTLIMVSQMDVDRQYLNFTFTCHKWIGEPTIMEPEKCDDLEWFDANTLPELLTPTVGLLKAHNFDDNFRYEFVDTKRSLDISGA
jgi:8-oxo-dGTP diphosphatase